MSAKKFDSGIVSELQNSDSGDHDNRFCPPQSETRPASSINDVEIENGKLDLQLKERFASHALRITYGWLGLTMFLFFITGTFRVYGSQFLSDSVLIALISGTSLSVITGMITTILRYLFRTKER